MTRVRLEIIWAWSWLCWLLIVQLPYQFAYSAIGMKLLPWAGLYAYTEDGKAQFLRDFDLQRGVMRR